MSNFRSITGPESARICIDGAPYLNFVGSCYLAQQAHPTLMAAGRQALESAHAWYQIRTAAHSGVDPHFDRVGDAGARYFGTETAVYMPSGYFAGPAAVTGLEGGFECVVLDELSHYSLVDAARQSQLPIYFFRHLDPGALAQLLQRHCRQGSRPLLMTDGVFSTSGAVAPLAEYEELLRPFGGQLFVDESHAYGVLGENGRGAAEHCGIKALHAGSVSKGLCAHGGIFPCSREFAARIKSKPPLKGVGAGSPISAAVTAAALDLAQTSPDRRAQLLAITQRLKQGLRSLGLEIRTTPAPITSFKVGSKADMHGLQKDLHSKGVNVVVSNYLGAGPEGVIRCATFADHTEADIDRFVDTLRHTI